MLKLNRAKIIHDYDAYETDAGILVNWSLSVLEDFASNSPEAFSARFGILGEKLLEKFAEKS